MGTDRVKLLGLRRQALGSKGRGLQRTKAERDDMRPELWRRLTADHACPVCGLVHSLAWTAPAPAEVRAFRARMGRVLGLRPGRMLDQKRAAVLLRITTRQLGRYENGAVQMPQDRAALMARLLDSLTTAEAVRKALGMRLAKAVSSPRRKRAPVQLRNS